MGSPTATAGEQIDDAATADLVEAGAVEELTRPTCPSHCFAYCERCFEIQDGVRRDALTGARGAAAVEVLCCGTAAADDSAPEAGEWWDTGEVVEEARGEAGPGHVVREQ